MSSWPEPITTLTTASLTAASLAAGIAQGCLLTLEQLPTSLTVLAINASARPDQSVRVRALLRGPVEATKECEEFGA